MPKHHYVPQFYLKRFGNGKYISAILMDHDFRFVEKASIRDQSCKPDYYAFSEVEHICSQLEGEASRLMQVVDQATQLTPNQITSLKQYFVFQIVRTPAYVQAFENAMSVAVSSMYAMSTGHEGFNNSKLLATVKNAKMWAWKQMAQLTDTLSDLNMTYLVSTRNSFITSDQPVARYNPWALKGGLAGQGFGCRGLMLFLPINSRITIMLYDSQAYNIRAKDQRSTHITIDRNDEERLNKLQMTSHRSRLYLPQPEQYQTVEKLARHVRFNHPPASEIPTPMINCSEDGRSQLSSFTTEPINFGDWSFLYESKEWRKVRRNIRGVGVYTSRDTAPDAGPRGLLDMRPWNSTKYIDDEGGVSYLRRSPRDLAR